ncbi:MAG TPA: prepilin-type N-terminal cleavage/methylation domain-containing protein [Phycisphaerae bacterium]|nr:prepilin-type N-terminal cleavage/methylation domain-containing protein [Phycisphaerae bacterium]HRW53705.1 prepilin-type N-terminal cleavage/methylation domain-containing protein [Phycisphaerae bacterium]
MIPGKRRRGFTLLEVLVACPLLAMLLGLLAWSLIYHQRMTRGVMEQSHRQETMHRVLRSLRTDLLEADTVEHLAPVAGASVPAEIAELAGLPSASDDAQRTLADHLTLARPAGDVAYYLLADTAITPRSANSTLSDLPPEYILVRIAANDDIPARIWPLRDLIMRILPPAGDAADSAAQRVDLVFESAQNLDARAPMRRVFRTTLCAGGAR